MAEQTTSEVQIIKKSIDIAAPKEKVWQVLTDSAYTKIWYDAFCEGCTDTEIDWKVGGKAVFLAKSGDGMVGKVKVLEPGKCLIFEFDGMLFKGVEDLDHPESKAVKGAQERYWLTEQNGITTLRIEADMNPEYYNIMESSWEKGLQLAKELAENK